MGLSEPEPPLQSGSGHPREDFPTLTLPQHPYGACIRCDAGLYPRNLDCSSGNFFFFF